MMNNYKTNCCLVERGMELCCENLRGARIPEKGIFSPFRGCFNFRGSKNEAFFVIEHQSGNIRWLRFMVVRPGSDMVVSNYMKKGTNHLTLTTEQVQKEIAALKEKKAE